MRSVKCGTEAAAVQSRTSAAGCGVRVQVTTGATAGRRVSADVSTASCRLYRRRTGTERCTRRRRRQHGFRRNFSSRWSVTKPRRSSARVIGCRANPRCARADDEGPSTGSPASPAARYQIPAGPPTVPAGAASTIPTAAAAEADIDNAYLIMLSHHSWSQRRILRTSPPR